VETDTGVDKLRRNQAGESADQIAAEEVATTPDEELAEAGQPEDEVRQPKRRKGQA
jgi:hypothetical protein